MSGQERVLAFQRALGALLGDAATRDAFERDPDGWLAPWNLAPGDAFLLRSLPVERLKSFHELHARDRAYLVRAMFPLTLTYVGEEIVPRFYQAQPEHRDFAEEAARFAAFVRERFARGDIPHRAARDLAAYEEAVAALRARPPAPIPEGAPPAEDENVVLSPHVRLFVYGANLPDMVEAMQRGEKPVVRPNRGWVVLRRVMGGNVLAACLEREQGWFLESFRAEPARPADVIEDDEDRQWYRDFVQAGILVRPGDE